MKEIYLFFVCFFVITLVGSIEYHGDRRFYTTVIDGKTYIALHVLKEPIKLVFPNDKTFVDLASDLQVFSSTENGKCEDEKNTLNFTLLIADKNHIRGETLTEIVNNVRSVTTYLYERCGGDEYRRNYAAKLIDVKPENLESLSGRKCFTNGAPFESYDKDNTKHLMDLQVNGTFNCQVFMILPSYMEIEDLNLNDTGKLELNETFVGHDDKYWWRTENNNDEMIPNGITFDENKNVKINLLKSTVMTPYFFRIGINQPVPSLKFEFGEKCNGAKFGFFLNLRDKIDCKYLIHLDSNGFNFFSRNVQRGFFVSPSTKRMTLTFGKYLIYVKVDSPLMIKSFEACELTNSPNVPSDQFVLQIAPSENIGECEKAEIILPKSDVFGPIEVLINRSKIVENETEIFENSTLFSSPFPETSTAAFEWWWILVGGILLLVIFIAAIIILVYFIRRRRQKTAQKPKKRKIRQVSESAASDRITVQQPKTKDKTKTKEKIQPKTGDHPKKPKSDEKLKSKDANTKPKKEKSITTMETEFEEQPKRPISWMEESPKNKKAEESEHSNIRRKDTTLTATTATTQNDDSTLQIKSTQNPSQKSVAAEN